jgi:hypothetical protein
MKLSPMLQWRLDAQNAKANPVATAPVFNFSIGKEIVEFFNPRARVPATIAPPT